MIEKEGSYLIASARNFVPHAPRPTDDIDIFWLDAEDYLRTLDPLRQSVQAITRKYALNPNWFNFVTQMLHSDEMYIPDGKLWKRFGPLHIHLPTNEYILALKIKAGRGKDLADCVILLPKTKIRTRQQAQQLIDRYITPVGQEINAEQITEALNSLFGEE
jgi:hypothetical protein